ncbi:MAG: hypothetical protein ACR2RV_11130 [Verrucomicrobiales bacterium]
MPATALWLRFFPEGMATNSRGIGELVICAALAAATFVLSFSIAKPGRATPQLEEDRKPRSTLTALEPVSAKASVRKLIRTKSAPSTIWVALQHCDSADLAELFEATNSPRDRGLLMNRLLVLARWTEIDPPAAADAALADWDAFRNIPAVIGMWADLDPHAALDYVDTFQHGLGTNLAYTAAIASARQRGDINLEPLFARLPQDQKGIEKTHSLFTGDRLAAFRRLLSNSVTSTEASSRFFPWFASDFADDLLEKHPASEIIGVYAEDSHHVFGDPSSEILAAYYLEDPAVATGWITEREDPFEAARLGLELASGLIETHPQQAARVLEDLPLSANREETLGDLAERWGESDPDAFRDWRDGLRPGDQRTVDQRLGSEDGGGQE